jgi:hypothetical protein
LPFLDPLLLVAGFAFDMKRTLVQACCGVSRNDSRSGRIRALCPREGAGTS